MAILGARLRGYRMISDDERREAARKLREIELSKGGYVEWWKIAKAGSDAS